MILKGIGMVAGVGLLMALNGTAYSQEGGENRMPHRATTAEIEEAFDAILFDRRSIGRPKSKGISAPIRFAYGSAALSPEAKAELSKYGQVLSLSKYKSANWAIEGHTDAAGSAEYNQQLSEQRARSVYNYLIQNFDVAPDQLVPFGKGETDLYDKANPFSGENRRVRIRLFGG